MQYWSPLVLYYCFPYQEALSLYKDAYGVKPNDKLQRKIDRIQQYLNQQREDKSKSGEITPAESGQESQQMVVKSEGGSEPSVKCEYSVSVTDDYGCLCKATSISEVLSKFSYLF